MKRALSTIMIIMAVFMMSSCQLAITNDSEHIPGEVYYPYSVVMEVYDGGFQTTDLFGMFDWNWLCNEDEIDLDCSSMNYGEGLFIDSHGMFVDRNETTDVTTTDTKFEIKTTIYVSENNSNFLIYPSILYGNTDLSDTYSSQMSGMMLQGNISVNFVVTNKISDYDTMTIDFTIAVEIIDELTNVEFAEYDDDDQYLASTTFNSIDDAANFTTDSMTAYIIAIETYEDSDGNPYKVRTLITPPTYTTTSYYSPKFTWDDGFVHNIVVLIEWALE